MGLVTIRMPKARLVMTDDRVVPVRNVQRPFRTKTHVYRTKRDTITGNEGRLLHRLLTTGKLRIRLQSMPINRVLEEPAGDQFPLHFLRPNPSTGHVDPTEFAQPIRLDDLPTVGQLLATDQEVWDAVNLTILPLCHRIAHRRLCRTDLHRPRPIHARSARDLIRLPHRVKDRAPRIQRHSGRIRLQPPTARPVAPKARAVERLRTPGCRYLRVAVQPLVHDQGTIRRPNEAVDVLVCVPGAKATENHLPHIRHIIAIRVRHQPQFCPLSHIHTVPSRRGAEHTLGCQFQAHRLLQSSGKNRAFVRPAIAIGVFQDDHLVICHHARVSLWIRRRLHAPKPPLFIPPDRDRIGHAIRLIRKQTHLKARQHFKRRQFCLPGVICWWLAHRDRLQIVDLCAQHPAQQQQHSHTPFCTPHGSFLPNSFTFFHSACSFVSINPLKPSISVGNQRCRGSP